MVCGNGLKRGRFLQVLMILILASDHLIYAFGQFSVMTCRWHWRFLEVLVMATQLRRNQGGPADRLTWTPTILGTFLLVTQFWSKLVNAMMVPKSMCILLLKQGAAPSVQNSHRPSWHCAGNWAPSSQWGGWLSLPQVELWSQIDRSFQQVDFKVTYHCRSMGANA